MLWQYMQHSDLSGCSCVSLEHTVNATSLITSASPVSTQTCHLKRSAPGSFDSTILVQKAEGSETLLKMCRKVFNAGCTSMPLLSLQSNVLSRKALRFDNGAQWLARSLSFFFFRNMLCQIFRCIWEYSWHSVISKRWPFTFKLNNLSIDHMLESSLYQGFIKMTSTHYACIV